MRHFLIKQFGRETRASKISQIVFTVCMTLQWFFERYEDFDVCLTEDWLANPATEQDNY